MSQLQLTTKTTPENPIAGDLHIVNRGVVVLDGLDAIAQEMRQKLSLFRGDWFLDQREGFPYFQELLKKAPNLQVLRRLIRETVLGVNGVLALSSLDLQWDRPARVMTIVFEAETNAGNFTSADYGPFILEVR